MDYDGNNVVIIISPETEELSHFLGSGIHLLPPSMDIHFSDGEVEVESPIKIQVLHEPPVEDVPPLAVLMNGVEHVEVVDVDVVESAEHVEVIGVKVVESAEHVDVVVVEPVEASGTETLEVDVSELVTADVAEYLEVDGVQLLGVDVVGPSAESGSWTTFGGGLGAQLCSGS